MIRITHPRPQLGRQSALGVEFVDGVATVETLHPERELALQQHGFEIVTELVGVALEDLSIPELREIANQEGIDLPAKAKKPEIIATIEASPNIPVLSDASES